MKKTALIFALLVLAGCEDGEAYRAACEAKDGKAYWLRNSGWICLQKDVVIEIRKTGGYQ